jgi:hypothetical protein
MISRKNAPSFQFDVPVRLAAVAAACLAIAGCNKAALLAPTNSTITLTAGTRVLPNGGTTQLTAVVLENSGQPVPNGTTVRFTASLGRIDPIEAETQNGIAVATFVAGNDSGVAEVRAISGLASGGTGTTTGTGTGGTGTTTTSAGNVVQITIGTAAVETVVLRANPGSVGPNGGNVQLTALVTGPGGQQLQGIQVAFASTQGQINPPTALTNQAGEATTTLATDRESSVTATAGSKTSTAVTVGLRAGPAVTLTCAVGTAPNCASVTIGQSVTFTVTPGANTSRIREVTLDFGDGTSLNLGAVTGATTVGHTYATAGSFTARATATDTAGEQIAATQFIQVRGPLGVALQLEKLGGFRVRATATVTGGTESEVAQYEWTFEGGTPNVVGTNPVAEFTYSSSGPKTVTVRVTMRDGRVGTASGVVTLDTSGS